MARQAKFRDDGTLTSVPTGLGERPQLEKQLDLLRHQVDAENLANLKEEQAHEDSDSQTGTSKGTKD